MINVTAFTAMLSHGDLVFAYKAVVKELYPDVFICQGGYPIISISLPFIDPQIFRAFAWEVAETSMHYQADLRREAIARNVVVFCRELWQRAVVEGKSRPKEWAFERVKGASGLPHGKGCVSVLVVGFISGGLLAALWMLL